MDTSHYQQLHNLRENLQRRLELLEQQAARFGAHVDAHIVLEIQDIRAELIAMDHEIANKEHHASTAHWPAAIPNDRYYPLPSREHMLTDLLATLHDPLGTALVVIDGLGGMGKTAFAAELARRALATKTFDGLVGDSAKRDLLAGDTIIPVREVTLDFDTLLDTIARQLGRWDLPTRSADEKRAALAQILHQHRYLLFIDNLETSANAQTLVAQLRGYLSTSRAIVTSRELVRHDAVRSVSLGGLDFPDTLFFLRADALQRDAQPIHRLSEAQLAEVHALTGGAPLALKLVVAQSQFLDLAVILQLLRSAGTKLYPFIFQQSWEALNSVAQHVLIYIGRTVITTVGWEELSSIGIAEDIQTLAKAIDQLIAYSLLQRTIVDGQMRYSIHQLTRQFIESDLPAIWRQQGLA